MYERSGIHAPKHRSDGCFPTPLGRQPTFSNTLILRIILFIHHQAVVYPWKFEAGFGDQMFLMMPIYHGLRKGCLELETSSVVVEILPPYLLKRKVYLFTWKFPKSTKIPWFNHHLYHHHRPSFWKHCIVKLGSDVCPRVDNQTSGNTLQGLTWPIVEKSPSASYPPTGIGANFWWQDASPHQPVLIREETLESGNFLSGSWISTSLPPLRGRPDF